MLWTQQPLLNRVGERVDRKARRPGFSFSVTGLGHRFVLGHDRRALYRLLAEPVEHLVTEEPEVLAPPIGGDLA